MRGVFAARPNALRSGQGRDPAGARPFVLAGAVIANANVQDLFGLSKVLAGGGPAHSAAHSSWIFRYAARASS
jgi:hypothetical protein